MEAVGSAALRIEHESRHRLPPPPLSPGGIQFRSPGRQLARAAKAGAGARWLLWLRHYADVRLGSRPAVRVGLPGFVVRDRTRDDDVLALLPIHRSRHLVLRRELQRVDDAQDLVEVAAGSHRVDENELDLLVRANHEHVPDGLVIRWRPALRIA